MKVEFPPRKSRKLNAIGLKMRKRLNIDLFCFQKKKVSEAKMNIYEIFQQRSKLLVRLKKLVIISNIENKNFA